MSMKNFPVHSQQLILYKTEWNPDFSGESKVSWEQRLILGVHSRSAAGCDVSEVSPGLHLERLGGIRSHRRKGR